MDRGQNKDADRTNVIKVKDRNDEKMVVASA